jgi:alanyl-tRNA synthetase
MVRRQRLIERLLKSQSTRLVLLTAPAGYSKTTCMAEWATADKRPFAWISANHRHDDAALFVTAVVEALGEIEPVDPDILASLGSPDPSILAVTLPRLSRSFGERSEPFVLVIDDVHRLSSKEAFEVLTALIEMLPHRGGLALGDVVTATVDANTRQATVLNHSATHLLHAALRKVLGTHVIQKGSLVAPNRLRFDFSHTQAVTPRELEAIESLVNAEIRRNSAAEIRQLPYDEAIKAGAIALFGEKYGDEVRVLRFGDFSTELCGGTHVARTGDIGLFRVTSEGGIASGIRRIEAVTGEGALATVRDADARLRHVATALRATPAEVEDKLAQVLERQKKLEREVANLKSKLAAGHRGDLAEGAVYVHGVQVLATAIEGADAQSLREAVDSLKGRLGSAVIVLGTVTEDGKVALVAGVTADVSAKVRAGDLVGEISKLVGGRGGGRPDFAQAGGTDPSKLVEALAQVQKLVAAKLGGT